MHYHIHIVTRLRYYSFIRSHNAASREERKMNVGSNYKNDFPALSQQNLDAIAVIMDDEIREELHGRMCGCLPGEFLTAYIELDPTMLDVLKQYTVDA